MAWKPDYVTLPAQKAFMHITDSADDVQIANYITAASRAIDEHCNRQFGKVAAAEERMYTARPNYRRGIWIIDIDDLDDATGLVVKVGADEIPAGSYTLEPVNAVPEGKVWERIAVSYTSAVKPTGDTNEMAITAPWGWSAFPVPVVTACNLQANRFASRRDSPFGVAGSPELGSELRLLAREDADVIVSLKPYVRRRKVG